MRDERLRAEVAAVGPVEFTSRNYRVGRVIHIVQFRYRSEVTQDARDEVAARFLALRDSMRSDGRRYIRSIQAGTQLSGEATIVADFDHAFVVAFDSLGDRNYYVGEPFVSDPSLFDPSHAEFKRFVGPLLAADGVAVFDFAPDDAGDPDAPRS